jgi:glutamate-ammonia-ligase adenylyltransferase
MDQLPIPSHIFRDPRSSLRCVDLLYEAFLMSGSKFAPDRLTEMLRPRLEASSDPDLAVSSLMRFSEASVSRSALFSDLIQFPVQADLIMHLFGTSRYFADILVREPGLLSWLNSASIMTSPVTGTEVQAEVDRLLDTFSAHQKRLDALKRLLRRQVLRIGAQDILGLTDLVGATAQLSIVADVLIDAAVRIAREQLAGQWSVAQEIPYAVIGLGKLGGEELNYSSDIDLLFVYGEETDESDPRANALGYFNKLTERVVQNLTGITAEGYLYRVDTRLRPESGAGPLARSVAGYLTYYESRGELWERQMLIKARPVGGDRPFGKEFLRQLEPFVYPRTFFEHPGHSIARIKARIETSVGEEQNIKLMAGGIRDIEFIVQTLQLVNGGNTPGLREGNTLRAIDVLRGKKYLTDDEASTLRDAYIFYRTIEHRLQMVMNRQTHTLPGDEASLTSLARRVGFSEAEELRVALHRHLSAIRVISEKILGGTPVAPLADIVAAVDGGLTDAAVQQALGPYGFRDLRTAGRALRFLTAGSGITGARTFDRLTKEAFRDVVSDVFDGIAATPVPDQTLAALVQVAGEQEFPGVFYKQLRDPRFRKLMLTVCAVSPRIARGLAHDPLLMDTVASDPGVLLNDRHIPALEGGDLHRKKTDLELRAGIRYCLGLSSLEQLTGELSAIAGGVIDRVMTKTAAGENREPLPLAVFALGKLGTCELGFDADCDLLFISAPGDAQEHCERRGREVLSELGAVTPAGRLYETDTRLRPEGKNAPLVVDTDGYARYLSTRASLWERQSLTRLRYLSGDSEVKRNVQRLIQTMVFERPLPRDWVAQVVAMRRRMETRSRTRINNFIDIKLGAGGMVDVEFIAQMVQLGFGRDCAGLRGLTTLQVLRSGDHNALESAERESCVAAYLLFRRVETLMKITLEERGSVLPEDDSLDRLARVLDGSDGRSLAGRVQEAMKNTRLLFLRVADRLRT